MEREQIMERMTFLMYGEDLCRVNINEDKKGIKTIIVDLHGFDRKRTAKMISNIIASTPVEAGTKKSNTKYSSTYKKNSTKKNDKKSYIKKGNTKSSGKSSYKKSYTKKSSKKSSKEWPDCDDYWDEDEFLDDWDGNMPDGSDAMDYWDNW